MFFCPVLNADELQFDPAPLQAQWIFEKAEVEHAPIEFRIGRGADAKQLTSNGNSNGGATLVAVAAGLVPGCSGPVAMVKDHWQHDKLSRCPEDFSDTIVVAHSTIVTTPDQSESLRFAG